MLTNYVIRIVCILIASLFDAVTAVAGAAGLTPVFPSAITSPIGSMSGTFVWFLTIPGTTVAGTAIACGVIGVAFAIFTRPIVVGKRWALVRQQNIQRAMSEHGMNTGRLHGPAY